MRQIKSLRIHGLPCATIVYFSDIDGGPVDSVTLPPNEDWNLAAHIGNHQLVEIVPCDGPAPAPTGTMTLAQAVQHVQTQLLETLGPDQFELSGAKADLHHIISILDDAV